MFRCVTEFHGRERARANGHKLIERLLYKYLRIPIQAGYNPTSRGHKHLWAASTRRIEPT